LRQAPPAEDRRFSGAAPHPPARAVVPQRLDKSYVNEYIPAQGWFAACAGGAFIPKFFDIAIGRQGPPQPVVGGVPQTWRLAPLEKGRN